MKDYQDYLNFLYQNTQMGVNTLKQMSDICEDENFAVHLKWQLDGYSKLKYVADELLTKQGLTPEGISTLGKISTYFMVELKTMADSSVSHLSEMLMQGSVMGIVQIKRTMRAYPTAPPQLAKLAEDLLEFEQQNLKALQNFL